MKHLTYLKLGILTCLSAFSFTNSYAVYTPVAVTGYNADVIANGTGLPTTSTTLPFDAASANPAYVLVSSDFRATASTPFPTYSLPASGTLNSLATPGLTYQLASYSGNNSLRLTGTTAPANTGTLTFPNPNAFIGDVYVLGATGSGTATATITINFAQGGTQVATATFNDWFNSTVVAVQGIGRADRATGVLDAGAGSTNPRLYEVKIPLTIANYGKTISSITITRTGGSSTTSVLNIMGISVDHQPCLPTPTVTAGSVTTVGATLSWTAVAGSQGYEYMVSSTATPPASGTPHATNSIALGGLNPGTTYYFHVRNKCGTTSYSVWNTISFSTLACPIAGTPTITNNTPGTVSFSWPGTSTPGVVNYQWAVTPTAGLPGTWNTTTATSATYNALMPGSVYYIHVRSNCGTSFSTYTPLQFTNVFPPCAQPSMLTVSGVNMHGADMTWNSSPDVVNGYQYALTTTATPPTTGISLTTDTVLVRGNLTAGQKYYFWLRTHCGTSLNNVANVSPWMVDSFTTPLTCLPASGASVTNVTTHSADIAWQRYPGIHSYEYVINTSATPPATGISGTAITFNNLAATSLFSGTGYYFHLRIRCDTFNYSPWITSTFNTTSVCNAAPSSVMLTALAQTQASFAWSGVPGAQQYQYCATTTNVPDPNSNTYTSQTSATVLSLNPSTAYYFHVRAYCSPEDLSGWETIPFSTGSVSVDPLTGREVKEVYVYPNPVKDLLRIEVKGGVKGKPNVMLMDMKGQVLRQVELNNSLTEINIQDLPQGMYLIRYHDAENTKTLRINKL